MKNRNWICYALDICGTIALVGAGLALIAALWFAASMPEPLLLIAFKYCLITAVSAFVTARVFENTRLLRVAQAPVQQTIVTSTDNVQALPQPEQLPRAA